MSAQDTNTAATAPIMDTVDPNEVQQLTMMIKTWRDIQKEADELSSSLKEKKKRMNAMEEVILRIMKKLNLGAVDLHSSGGRLLMRRQTTKGSLPQKELVRLLGEHMKSDQKATEASKYITEHRGQKVKELLLDEKE